MGKSCSFCWQNEIIILIDLNVFITIQTYNEFRNSVIFGYFLSFESKCDYRPFACQNEFLYVHTT